MPFQISRLLLLARCSTVDFGKAILWRMFKLFALFHLVETLGVDPDLAGMLVMTSLVADAATDPLVGGLIDGLSRRGWSYRLYYLVAPLIAGGVLTAFFSLTTGGWASSWQILIFLVAFRIAYTFSDIPANLSAVQIAEQGHDATVIWGMKKGFAMLGTLAISACVAPILRGQGGRFEPRNLIIAMGLLTLVTALAYVLSAGALPTARRGASGRAAPVALSARLQAVVQNGRLWMLVGVILATGVLTDALGAGMLFIGQNVVGDAAWSGRALFWIAVGGTVAIPCGSAIALRLGRVPTLHAALVVTALAAAAVPFTLLRSQAIYAVLAVYGFGLGLTPMMYWAISIDAVAPAARAPAPSQALSLSLMSASVKVGGGLNAALIGFCLQASQWKDVGVGGAPRLDLITLLTLCSVAGALIALGISVRLNTPPKCSELKLPGMPPT
ncbi:MFS transporter [Caulobacter segnis]|nr:MFS transporter [Caulobacter segnis]